MNFKFKVALFFVLFVPLTTKADPQMLLGKWVCSEYKLVFDEVTAIGSEQLHFKRDGQYHELEMAEYTFTANNESLSLTTERTGKWEYKENTIIFKKLKGKVIAKESKHFSLEELQQQEDDQIKKNPESEFLVLSLDNSLKYRIPDSNIEQVADKTYECKKA